MRNLVFLDTKGREVYEGDIVTDERGMEFIAYREACVNLENEFCWLDSEFGEHDFTLKEATS